MGSILMKPYNKIFEEEISGDVRVTESSQYNHLNADSVTISDGITVRLFGVVHKKLVIGKNATVYFHGSMMGELENHGGELYKH